MNRLRISPITNQCRFGKGRNEDNRAFEVGDLVLRITFKQPGNGESWSLQTRRRRDWKVKGYRSSGPVGASSPMIRLLHNEALDLSVPRSALPVREVCSVVSAIAKSGAGRKLDRRPPVKGASYMPSCHFGHRRNPTSGSSPCRTLIHTNTQGCGNSRCGVGDFLETFTNSRWCFRLVSIAGSAEDRFHQALVSGACQSRCSFSVRFGVSVPRACMGRTRAQT